MSKGKQRNTFKKPGELLLQRITCTCLQYVNSYVCVPAVHLDNFTPLICELVLPVILSSCSPYGTFVWNHRKLLHQYLSHSV